jgi:thiamine-phosphate pyrophosphorylase
MSLPNNSRQPILCYVTDRRSLTKTSGREASHALFQVIEAAVAAGIDWIQIREKDLSDRELSWLTHKALSRTARPQISKASGSRIIVNDRLSVALAEGAGGVHLGASSFPVKNVRSTIEARFSPYLGGSTFLVGSSCHSLREASSAAEDGADYIFFGPVFATPSKAKFGPPQGLERLAEVCRSLTIPVVAIGGITIENAASCLDAGASGLAAIRLFQGAPDLQAVVKPLRNSSL